MLGVIERLDKAQRKAERYAGGAVELPDYPGSLRATYDQLYPRYLAAPHLAPLFDAFERAKREQVHVCVSYPPRAGKTETVIAGTVDRLLWNPESRICYVSHGALLAKKKSARIRTLARTHGVPIDPTARSKQDWATGIGEGGLWATSVGGAITGMGFELLELDDLIASRDDAESAAKRDAAWDFLKNDAYTRLEPEGSVILNGTRWHEDDPIGRAVSELKWEEINVPALDAAGNSYWPKRWSTRRLLEIRETLGGEDGYEWCSLYMGNPRAKGERIFKDPTWADALPPGPIRVGIGVDFAYTAKKSSHYSSAVVLAEAGGVYYVVDVIRGKWPEEEFRARVGELAELYQAQFVVGYVNVNEQANITLLQRDGLAAYGERALTDKKTHALPTAAGWNTGRIRVLRGKSWDRGFTSEVKWFTGNDGARDDQVDALCTVYDAMWVSGPVDWEFCEKIAGAAPMPYMGLSN